jgi:hypothetical protein
MECATSRNLTNGITAGDGVLCGSAPIVTPYNNRGITGSGVSYWVRPEAYHENRRGKRISLESVIDIWDADPLEVVRDSRHWRTRGRLRISDRCKPLCSKGDLVVWQTPASEDLGATSLRVCETGSKVKSTVENVTQQNSDGRDWEH